MSQPTVFISYSHRDEDEKEALVSHLGVLAQAGLIDVWVDDRIEGGGDWEQDIAGAMGQAKVAILLVTRHFLNSKFILGTEVPTLLERRKREGVIVYPVIAKPCAWQRVDWLAKMNVRPRNGTPVWSKGSDPDEELAKIAEEVARIIEKAGSGGEASTALPKGKSTRPPASDPIQPKESGASRSGDVNISDVSAGTVTVGNVVTGNVEGDMVGGDKTEGDKVGGDKNTYNYYSSPPGEPPDAQSPKKSSAISAKWWVPIGVAVIGLIGVIFSIVWPDISGDPAATPSTDFTYQVRVQDKETGENIPNAIVTIEVGGKAPLDGITDSSGLARIFVSADHAGQPGRLLVEAGGYGRYRKEIDITEGALPKDVLLEPEP